MIVLTISKSGHIERMFLPDGAGTLDVRSKLVAKYKYQISVVGVPIVTVLVQADPQKRVLKDEVAVNGNNINITFSNGNILRRTHFQVAIITEKYDCPAPIPNKSVKRFVF